MTITVEQVLKDAALLKSLEAGASRCPYCGVLVQETITGKRRTPRGYACSDCYYEQLGEAVEASPITTGHVRRG